MKHKFLLLYSWFVRTILYFLPDIPFIMRFRGWLYGLGMKKCGKNFQVTHSTILNGLDKMFVGKNVYIANFGNIICNGYVFLGDNILIGPSIVISSGNHYFKNGMLSSDSLEDDILIGENVWIASHVTILAGVKIPNNSIIAAGAIVNKKSCTNSGMYAGVPAKFIKKICFQ